MTEKKCVSRRVLWAFALVNMLAMAAAGGPAAGNQPLVKDAGAGGAAGPPNPARSDGSNTWDFAPDRGYRMPQDWTAVSGSWSVLPDRDAPSEPNTLALP